MESEMNLPRTGARRKTAAATEGECSNQTLTEIASGRLRADIIAGRLKPGDRLTMDVLRARYGVSMSPLREALAGLAAERIIVFERHRGYQVGTLSVTDLRDITETRKLIEADVARLALRNGDDLWESDVVAAFHRLARAERRLVETGERGGQDWDGLNKDFHEAISAGCPLEWLKILRGQLFMQTQRYRVLAWSALSNAATVAAEHREIFEAAMARDEERLVAAMNLHIDNVALQAQGRMTLPLGPD